MFRKAAVPDGAMEPREGPGAPARRDPRLLDRLVLRAHALADRLEAVPPDFGAEAPVDEADAAAVRREWLRLFRQWAESNPEEVFAYKVGAALLGAAIIGLLVLIAAL